MSARAAWRLESLGFTQVYRYTPGKVDWMANGLPVEGSLSDVYQVVELAHTDVPICGLEELVGNVRDRVRADGWDTCVVTNENRVVLGLLESEALDSDPQARVEQVMDSAPRTYRLNAPLERIEAYFNKSSADYALVTMSDGRLVGVLKRGD